MAENEMQRRMDEYHLSEAARFLKDRDEINRLYGNKVNLDKSLYFANHPKEDFQ